MKQPGTAIYLRLSRDDDSPGESGSISTQRQMLRAYCAEHNFTNVVEYVDDGYSGTNFDRPGFNRMIDDIEDGRIGCVITKDLSRLGRNYILTGQYTEVYFPSHNVRYIAVNDNIDSDKGESEIAPFLNILNEMHARQTSKKVKSAFHTKFANGAHYGAYAPIGYLKDPERKGHLIPDHDSVWIVERIFTLAAHGQGGASIARQLAKEKVPTPAWINYTRDGTFGHIFEGKGEDKRYQWSTYQVKHILSDAVYIGHSVHNRQTNISFKNKKKIRKPEEEWYTVENTHDAIITQDLWDQAQAHIQSRKRPTVHGETQIFAGLLKCADCGRTLRYLHNHEAANTKGRCRYYCRTYSEFGKDKCSIHYIKYETIYNIVLERLRYWVAEAQTDEKRMLDRLMQSGDKQRKSEADKAKKELSKAEKRLKEVDSLYAKLYEDHASGEVNERNYAMLCEKYQAEQTELERRIDSIKADLQRKSDDVDNAEKWIEIIRKYTDITELTAPMLNELIDKIVVHEAEKDADGKRTQKVEIFYRFVGKIE